MSLLSKIEWTDATWNPVRGCTKISPGCKHCYAERFAERFRGVKGHPFEQGFDLRLVPHKLGEPLRWSEPDDIRQLDERPVSRRRAAHIYRRRWLRRCSWLAGTLIRCSRSAPIACGKCFADHFGRPQMIAHIWWGVSVEDRRYGLPRIADLQAAPAAVRFLSVEPLLEDLGRLPLCGISWVIVGGESGPGARPMKEEWVLSIREQCEAAGVPFFFKQWGGVRKKAAGRKLRGRTHDGFPERVQNPTLPALLRLKHALEIENTGLVQLV